MNKDFWRRINRPIIGLAPMDGYTDAAFRRVCKSVNPQLLVYTEFVSADGVTHNPNRLKKKLQFDATEQPILAQLFGKNIETMIRAAKVCEELGFSGIDLNMGCPAKKVMRSQHGFALRQNPDLAYRLIESIAKNTTLPVSVKTRLGTRDASDLQDFAIAAQNAGADMICVHARTFVTPYKGPADWNPLYALKPQLSIPLLGNGGLTDYADGLLKMQNLDGFLIGQAAVGKPWIFSTQSALLTFAEKKAFIFRHAELLIEQKGALVGTREIRKHLVAYFKDFPQAKQFRAAAVRVSCLKDITDLLNAFGAFEMP